MIKEKIVQDFGQPRFHIGSRVELFVGGEGANECLLDEILSVGRIFCQMKCHSIQMIEVNHGLICDSILPGASRFSLPSHGRILTNCAASV